MLAILEELPVRSRARPLTRKEYHLLGEAGLLDRTELLRGVVIQKMPKSPLHIKIVERLYRFFQTISGDDLYIRQEQPLAIDGIGSEPEPDLALICAPYTDFEDCLPTTADIVMEVAVSSVEMDRIKARDYAAAGVAHYYLINVTDREVEHYSLPVDGKYSQRELLRTGSLNGSAGSHSFHLPLEDLFR
ncbi:MAG: Uma2 family endonuclease [Spirochaetales bacterium]|nr:Uma2 family endonuclease [Spirochaetales bacterium]